MDFTIKNESDNFELITPEEFISRLKIAKSTLHLWKSKGWLLAGRHFVKFGSVVRYFWSEDRLIEIHENCNRDHSPQRQNLAPPIPSPIVTGERINWDYK